MKGGEDAACTCMLDMTHCAAQGIDRWPGYLLVFAMCMFDFADSDGSTAWESRRSRVDVGEFKWSRLGRENSLLRLFICDINSGLWEQL